MSTPRARPHAEVIGDPIAHSKSPLIHGFWLAKLGLEGGYERCHVRAEELPAYFAARRADPAWRGSNVTLPHKESVGPLLDRLDPRAERLGAVNTVYRDAEGAMVGTNTDVDGVADALAGMSPAHGPALVLGAGGAARAAYACLAERGWNEVRVLARSPDKARAAAASSGLAITALPFAPGTGGFAGAGVVINATQLGMTGQAALPDFVAQELDSVNPGALVFDMVYVPLETALLHRARELGFPTADGLTMLIGQAAVAFAKFFGHRPPREHDAELRELLTR